MFINQTKRVTDQCKLLLKKLVFSVSSIIGRYQPFTNSERECIQKEAVYFTGDLPKGAGSEYNQYRVEYKIPRPLKEEVSDLLYTPTGMAWFRGKLYERFSLREPSIKDLLVRPSVNKATEIPQGTVVQVETPYTYGDWVSEHLICLIRAMPISPPLLLPKSLMEKSYVRRDLERLGIEALAVEQSVLIRWATVLHKTRPNHYFTQEEVEAYRLAFAVSSDQPLVGSILYLSRLGVSGEGFKRQYPSKLVADILQGLGAKIVLTKQATYDDYRALGAEAETVIADFGSALLNIMMWNTKNVIILFTDDWWDGCALFIAKAIGISNIVLLRVGDTDRAELHRKLMACLNCCRAST